MNISELSTEALEKLAIDAQRGSFYMSATATKFLFQSDLERASSHQDLAAVCSQYAIRYLEELLKR